MIKKTIIEMDYTEFEELVDKHIVKDGPHYEYVACQELSNDSAQTYDGINGELGSYEREDIEKGELEWRARALLNRLCELGVIEPADYVITVCW